MRSNQLLNCGVRKDSWESLWLQWDLTSPSWIFIVRTDAETEAPILWPPDVKDWLTGRDPDTGEDWRQEKGTEDEILNGITDSMDMSLSKIQELWWKGKSDMLQPWRSQRVRHNWATKLNFKILYASLIVTTREKPLVIIQKNIIGKSKLIPKDIKTYTKKTAG